MIEADSVTGDIIHVTDLFTTIARLGGAQTRARASTEFTPDSYDAVMLKPLGIYRGSRLTERASAYVPRQIRECATGALKRQFAGGFDVVSSPGPGVARLRMAMTSVASKREHRKAHQLVPAA